MSPVVPASTPRAAVRKNGSNPTKASRVDVEFDRKVLYEVDGGDREKVRSLEISVVPGGLVVCVPPANGRP